MDKGASLQLQEYEPPEHPCDRSLLFLPDEETFLAQIKQDLLEGMTLCLPCTSHIFFKTRIRPLLEEMGLVEGKDGGFQMHYAQPLILCKDINAEWSRFRAVVYIFKVLDCVKYTGDHFDRMYLFVSSVDCQAQVVVRTLMGIASPRDAQIRCWPQQITDGRQPETEQEVQAWFEANRNKLSETDKKFLSEVLFAADEETEPNVNINWNESFQQLLVLTTIIVNKSKNNIVSELQSLATASGWSVDLPLSTWAKYKRNNIAIDCSEWVAHIIFAFISKRVHLLRSLVIEYINDAWVQRINSVLAQLAVLNRLVLYNGAISAKEAHKLANGLLQCKALAEFKLSGLNINLDGFHALFTALPKCAGLTTLDIQLTDISSDERIRILVAALPHCVKLTTLSLAENNMGPKEMCELAAALPQCVVLRSLDLRCNNLGSKGLGELTVVLPHCGTLRNLNFASNDVDAEGVHVLVRVLPQCPVLDYLNLTHNQIDSEAALALVAVLPQCPTLCVIDLTGNELQLHDALVSNIGARHIIF